VISGNFTLSRSSSPVSAYRESEEDALLADAAVPDQNELEQVIVIPLLGGRAGRHCDGREYVIITVMLCLVSRR